MRLLNARTKKLELRRDNSAYAIVSHRWGAESEEVLFTDISDLSRAETKERGYKKIHASCSMALSNGLAFVWIDTCCIDKRNERELTTAINSMYEWYQESEVCYAYLDDVGDISEFTKSEWFLRGWTLQELIAPRVLKFFAKDWTFLGTREDLIHSITKCTGIKSEIFLSGVIPHGDEVSVAQRMYWAAKRKTKEEEDRAYSLLGLFDIHLPAIYGIKQKAFQELQFKIVSKSPDKSLFAWQLVSSAAPADSSSSITGLLAASPSQYLNAYEIPCSQFYRPFGSKRLSRWECFSLKNGAVCVTLPIRQVEETSIHEALLRCSLDPPQNPPQSQRPLVVYLKQDNRHGRFVRVHAPTSLRPLEDDSMASFELEKVYVDEVSHRTSRSLEPGVQAPHLPQNAGSGPVSASSELASYEHTTNTDAAFGSEVAASSTQIQLTPTPDTSDNLLGGNKLESRIGVSSKCYPIRHSPGSKTINIVVCGEPGAGAGGVVNLIAGSDIVDSRTEFKCAPMTFTTHDISLNARNMRIFYTIGPQDHRLTVERYNKAMENVEELAQSLRNDGGVHVLLCCMLRTKPNLNIHCLFYEALCGQSVPVIVLGTDFTGHRRNLDVGMTGIRCNKYASISVIRPGTPEKSDDYENSVKTVRKLVIEHIDDLREAYPPHVGLSMRIILKEFMSTSAKRALTPLLSNELLHASSGLPGADPHSSSLLNSFAPKLSASVEKDGLGSCSRSTTLTPQIESNDPTAPCLPQPLISILAKTIPMQTSRPITPPFCASVVLQFTPQPLGLIGSNCSMSSRDSKGKKRALTSDWDVEAENTRPRKQAVSWPSQDPVHIVRLESDDDAGINFLAFSSDGQRLAVVCNDRTVRIWDMARRVETARLGQDAQIMAVAWMSDNTSMISLGQDGIISKWTSMNRNIWEWTKLLDAGMGDPVCFAYRRDRIAVALSRAGVKIWIWIEGTWQSQQSIPRQDVTSIQFVEDGKALIGGTSDGVLWYCQVPEGKSCVRASFKSKIHHLDVDGLGTYALVSQDGGPVHLVKIQHTDHECEIKRVYPMDGYALREQRPSFRAVFASGCNVILFGSTEGNLLVWDKFKGEVICRLDHSESEQVQAAACADCDLQACIVTGTKRGVLSWWKAPLTES